MKTNLVTFCAIFCLALIGNAVYAQISPTEKGLKKIEAEKIRKTKLIIMLMEENPDAVKKMTKKDNIEELERYKEIINTYNNNIKQIVEKHFPFAQNVEYKNWSQIKEMPVVERRKANFLAYNLGMKTQVNALGPGVGAVVPAFDFYSNKVYNPLEKRSFDFEDKDAAYSKMELYTYDKKDETGYKIVFIKTLPNVVPGNGDIAYWFSRANYLCEDATAISTQPKKKNILVENPQYLKEKTLLICKEDLDKETTEESIKSVYPFSFKLVTKAEYDNAIVSKESDKCVLVPLRIDGPMVFYVQEIMDLSSSSIAGFGSAKAMVAGMGAGGYEKVKTEHMKKYAESVKD